MKKLDGVKLCYARADDWDYEEVVEWRAKTPKDGVCDRDFERCGGGKDSTAKYCVPKDVFVDNNSQCPINHFEYFNRAIRTFNNTAFTSTVSGVFS